MKRKAIATAALLVGAVSLVWAQQAQQEYQQGQPGQQDRTITMERRQAQAGEQGANLDERYLECAIQANMFGQKATQLVADKAPNERVQQLAEKLHKFHQEQLQDLKKAAQGVEGFQAPTQLGDWGQARYKEMAQLDPQTLQREFLFDAIGAHYISILANKWAAQNVQNPQIKQHASRTAETLRQQLQQATQVTNQVAGVQVEGGMGVTGR